MEYTERFLLQNIIRCYKNQLSSKPLALNHIKAIEAIDGCGRGVLLYLSRYLRGGPVHPSLLVRCDSERIGFRHKDHRDKKLKVLELQPKELVR